MIDLEFCSPTKFVFGRGAEARDGGLAKTLGDALGLFRPLAEADVCENRKPAVR